MITPKDGGADGNGNAGSSSGGKLNGGAIAGIVVGSVLAALLIIGLITIFILRKRRKWLKAGFSAAAPEPKSSDSVLHGPVFNSEESRSTPGNAVLSPSPFAGLSAAGTRSTGTDEHTTTSARDSMTRQDAATGGLKNIDGGSTPELDGHDTLVRPNTELDGHEIGSGSDRGRGQPPQRVPGVFELPGSEVRVGMNREISTVGDLPLFRGSKVGGAHERDSQRTLSVSTMGTTSQDRGSASDLVSPSSPTSTGQNWEAPTTGTRNLNVAG